MNLENEEFVIKKGVLYEYKGKGGKVIIPEGVTKIDNGVFKEKNIEEVIIPNTVVEIGNFAFGQN